MAAVKESLPNLFGKVQRTGQTMERGAARLNIKRPYQTASDN